MLGTLAQINGYLTEEDALKSAGCDYQRQQDKPELLYYLSTIVLQK
jgi:hypothetical protein